MRTRITILILLGLVLVLALLLYLPVRRPEASAPVAARPAKVGAAELDSFFTWHEVASFSEARAMLRNAYRLRPDGRFLRAVADVPVLAGARLPGSVSANWDGCTWWVRCGADTVGILPAYPTYADARALLEAWAGRWTPAGADTPGTATTDSPADPLATLSALDARWKSGDRGAPLQAAGGEALAWLVFANSADVTRQSDLFAGRALAALALANRGGVTTLRTHVLIARLLGYEREAAALAAALPVSDPRRAWAMRDTAALERLVKPGAAALEARLLALHAIAAAGSTGLWHDRVWRDFGANEPGQRLALATGFGLRSFSLAEPLSEATAYGTALETQRWTGADTAKVRRAFLDGGIAAAFERLLLRGGPRAGGPFLDAAVVQAHARAQLYTALTVDGLHLSHALFDESGARDEARWFGRPGDGPAGEFARWYGDLVESTWHDPDAEAPALSRDILESTTLGVEQLEQTYDEAAPKDRAWVPLLTHAMVHRMDTRPHDRDWLAWTSIVQELALEGREELLAASAAAGGPGGAVATMWLAAMHGDDAGFVRSMGSRDVNPEAKARMLTLLQDPAEPLARLQACAGAACSAHPGNAGLALAWATGLEAHHASEDARRMLEKWLDRSPADETGLATGRVLARVARYYREAGMPDRAWTIVRHDSTGMFAMLAEQALTLDALGRSAEGLSRAEFAADRYHGEAAPCGVLATLHWAHGRDTLAAEAMMPTLGDGNYWRWTLAPEFVKRFRGRAPEALAAVAVMAHRFGVKRYMLQHLARAYQDAGDPGTGFAVLRLAMSSGVDRAFGMVEAYGLVKAARGPVAAMAWLDSMPASARGVRELTCETGVARGHDELAWLDSLPSNPQSHDWGLLVRAPGTATMAAGDLRRAGMQQELHARAGTYYLTLARYVAEGGDEAAAFHCGDDLRKRCEVFYWAGRRAEIEGREADAAACYQLSIETAQTHQGEWLWSRERLIPLLSPLRPLREGPAKSHGAIRST